MKRERESSMKRESSKCEQRKCDIGLKLTVDAKTPKYFGNKRKIFQKLQKFANVPCREYWDLVSFKSVHFS